jgi:hypothetical protein
LGITQERLTRFAHRAKLRPHKASGPQTVVGRESLGRVFDAGRKLASPSERSARFQQGMSSPMKHCVSVSRLQAHPRQPLYRGIGLRALAGFVRHLDGLAEMRYRLLEGGAAQCLVAGLAPPFDRRVGLARMSEVMRERFRLAAAVAAKWSRKISATRRCSIWRRLLSRFS